MNKLPREDKSAPNRLNHWVDPSFVDFQGESRSPLRRKCSQGICLGLEPKRLDKKKGQVGTPATHKIYLQRNQDEPWVDRYSPCSQAELAVHKKKIEEVENWIRVHSNTLKGGILLLTGPSGCGKTTTVQILSEELGLRVQQWTNPINQEPHFSSQDGGWMDNGFCCSSQISQFRDFLLRAYKYNCLKMVGDGATAEKKFILVEDFPNQFYRQPGSLHDILRRFVKSCRCPLVFIVSDSLSGDSRSRFLFPRDIQDELNISSISFNPVAPTTMMKVLTRISTLEAEKSCGKMLVPNQAVLEKLCSGSSGDIRSAINSLQFSSFPDTSVEKGRWRIRKDRPVMSLGKGAARKSHMKKSYKTKEQDEEQAVGGKDVPLFLFRALGKILHCKRGTLGSSESAECDPEQRLPSHLSHQQRKALLVNPEVVVERSHIPGELFNLYLHQNYLDFFSGVDDVDQASKYLSDADLLTADWLSHSTMEDYGSSISTRGLLHSSSQKVSVGFRPLHKPNWLLVNKNHQDNCLTAQSLFKNFCLTPICLKTELLPYLAKVNIPMRSQAQITFIQDVGQMPLRTFSCRLKLENLTDNYSDQMEIDTEKEEKKEEDHADVEENLSASQTQPTTTHLFLGEEDPIIDQYISD
ncbi:cell cycle checkpoint protein RAD17 [Brachionichthys hirsutus]|uniref:cell cycle checkpoint protein RAD17 n=1 Tax=Brachionichthys hirsutus TaxID=412623 RepID=UPI0036046777